MSADLDELVGLSDTIVVLYGGRMVARLDPATTTLEQLGCYMTGTDPAGTGDRLDLDAAVAEVKAADATAVVAPSAAGDGGPTSERQETE